jgi:hypothetical protein
MNNIDLMDVGDILIYNNKFIYTSSKSHVYMVATITGIGKTDMQLLCIYHPLDQGFVGNIFPYSTDLIADDRYWTFVTK